MADHETVQGEGGGRLDQDAVRRHWQDWATSFGQDVRATTRSPIAKSLEIAALARRLAALPDAAGGLRVLEMGCGNGVNLIALARRFDQARFDGVDYVPEMAAAATASAAEAGVADRVAVRVGDVTAMAAIEGLAPAYDVVFTDRCLINLGSVELQKQAIAGLAGRTRPGGRLIMIENSTATHARQNACRETLGLPPRVPAAFNLFFDEAEIRPHLAACSLDLVEVEDFSSLHDLLLYVLVPILTGGTIDYDHPLVHAAAKLSLDGPPELAVVGALGQNRMFVCERLAEPGGRA